MAASISMLLTAANPAAAAEYLAILEAREFDAFASFDSTSTFFDNFIRMNTATFVPVIMAILK
jgi:hypothetical protein